MLPNDLPPASLLKRRKKCGLDVHPFHAGPSSSGNTPERNLSAIEFVSAGQVVAAPEAGHTVLLGPEHKTRLPLILSDDHRLVFEPHQFPIRLLQRRCGERRPAGFTRSDTDVPFDNQGGDWLSAIRIGSHRDLAIETGKQLVPRLPPSTQIRCFRVLYSPSIATGQCCPVWHSVKPRRRPCNGTFPSFPAAARSVRTPPFAADQD